jgi:hypothetical protein
LKSLAFRAGPPPWWFAESIVLVIVIRRDTATLLTHLQHPVVE